MKCQQCGRENPTEVSFCQGCGTSIYQGYPQQGYQQQSYSQQSPPGYPPAQGYGPSNYAGIGTRFLASLIDGIIIGIPIGIISTVLSTMMAVRVVARTSGRTYDQGMAATDVGTFFAGFGFIMILSFVISWAYFAMMESSSWQATVGKKVMGIQVADINGGRISLGKATVRVAVKGFLSGWFAIGYIMAFFTQRKQALHDLIAGTLVLTKDAAGYPPTYPAQYPQQPTYPQQPAAYPQQSPNYSTKPLTVCPNCSAALTPGARFCSNCGKNI